MNAPLLVVATAAEAKARPALELVALARDVAPAARQVAVVVPGEARRSLLDELAASGADGVYAFSGDPPEASDSDALLAALAVLARELAPEAILIPHDAIGADLAPRLAYRLDGAVATGCVAVQREADGLVFTRPCHGGNARESLWLGTCNAVATFRGGSGRLRRVDGSRLAAVVLRERPRVASRTRVVGRRRDASGTVSLHDARVVVAGGRGVGGADAFRALGDLAALLGGVVGASRVACDLGWWPHSGQVGLTGKTVTPDLYIAVGISGASHHMAGCAGARCIVAINDDPDAPIFRAARFGVVGDAALVVPALADALRRLARDATAEGIAGPAETPDGAPGASRAPGDAVAAADARRAAAHPRGASQPVDDRGENP